MTELVVGGAFPGQNERYDTVRWADLSLEKTSAAEGAARGRAVKVSVSGDKLSYTPRPFAVAVTSPQQGPTYR